MLRPFSQTLSTADALHLLRRTTFATSWSTVKNFAGKTVDVAVDILLDNALRNPKPTSPSWINSGFPSWWKLPQADQQKAIDAVYKRVYEENYEIKRW